MRRTVFRTTVAAAVAVVAGLLVPAPSSADEYQTAKSAVQWTAQYCPQNPTDPTGVGTLHGDCWSPTVNHADFMKRTLTEIGTAPAVWFASGANDVVFNGAEPNTDVEDNVAHAAMLVSQQVDTLLSLVYFRNDVTTNADRVHATATVRAAGVTKEQTAAVGLFCNEEGCVERELNEGLSGCLGCVNPLAYSTLFYGESTGSYSPDSPQNFEHAATKVVRHDPRYKSGGPNHITGRAIFKLYVQRYKISQVSNFVAGSQFYSVGPYTSRIRLQKMHFFLGGKDGTTELTKADPSSDTPLGPADTRDVNASLSTKFKGVGASFLLSRTWQTPEGYRGGTLGGDNRHHVKWWHKNKKGTSLSRELAGTSVWESPNGVMPRFYVGWGTWYLYLQWWE